MKCVDREKLFACVHGMLGPPEEREVREHVAACAACGHGAHEFEGLDTLLDEWRPTQPSPGFDARVRAAVASSPAARPALFRLGWLPVLAPALVALIVAGSLVVFRARRSPPLPPPPAVRVKPPLLPPPPSPSATPQVSTPEQQADAELALYENLPVLEDYDLLKDFDVLSELQRGGKKIDN